MCYLYTLTLRFVEYKMEEGGVKEKGNEGLEAADLVLYVKASTFAQFFFLSLFPSEVFSFLFSRRGKQKGRQRGMFSTFLPFRH